MTKELLNIDKTYDSSSREHSNDYGVINIISKQISEEFEIYDVPFLGCDFDSVYPDVAGILPKEAVTFGELSFENAIGCEVICAAICHQMNWDYLRQAVLQKTQMDTSWLYGGNLSCISEEEVVALFAGYNKQERVRAKERCEILHQVGEMINELGGYQAIFMDMQGELLPIDMIRKSLLKCPAFSIDPKEKKLQLLLQKLSIYEKLRGLSLYCKPAIDYHLVRCYLRRQLLFPKTKFAEDFIMATTIKRKETTVGALRHLCSTLLEQIAWYTGLDICEVNAIEWNIGRSVCTQNHPDCYLEHEDAAWLKEKYVRCPFFESCRARQNGNVDIMDMNEPKYMGTSY